MSRRHVKEFRPDEALSLITADREGKALQCPSCGSDSVNRNPHSRTERGRVALSCGGCGRLVEYVGADS